MKIIVAGGSGFIGKALIHRLLERRNAVTVISRNREKSRRVLPERVDVLSWDGSTVGPWASYLDGADAVINLAGENIGDGRWTASRKSALVESRITATRALVKAIERAERRPSVLVNASAVGYYGNVPDGEVTEDSPAGADFLAELCRQWETTARAAEQYGVRVVLMRTGIVLDRRAGALKKLLLPFRMFVGGPLGSGDQWFPWVHLDDEISAFLFALDHTQLSGPVNIAAPESVRMKEFCRTLGEVMHRPSWAPVPGFVLKILLGEMAEGLVLGGQRQVPRKLLDLGFPFRHPKLPAALQDILTR